MINEDSLSKDSSTITQNHQLEGQCKILTITYLAYNPIKKYLLFPILCIITCFLIISLIRKYAKIYTLILFSQVQPQQATHLLIYSNDNSLQIVDTFKNQNKCHFYYKKVKYQYDQKSWAVCAFKLQQSQIYKNKQFIKIGLSNKKVEYYLQQYGYCEHLVQIPGLFSYLFSQLTDIFFIFQYLIVIMYLIETFYVFAVLMISFSIITTTINYYLLKNSYLKIKQVAEKHINVQVLRESQYILINSRQLVPGDIFVINDFLPCDSILIQGQIYVNQAGLTGQSIPIAKFPIQNIQYIKQTSWLYQGSSVLEKRGRALGLVINTGFITRKGRIIRKILYRQSQKPQFFKKGILFLLELLTLSFIIYFLVLHVMIQRHIQKKLIILRFFGMIGWIIPPIYPIYFNLCYSFSLYRLTKKNIYGTEPFKTIVSGKVKTMCFDKTGTLTQNMMKLYSIFMFKNLKQYDEIKIQQNQQLKQRNLTSKLFATCHTVRKIDNQFMGDQLDLRMFLSSGYSFEISKNPKVICKLKKQSSQIEVLKVNQFQSKFQSMSVIIRDCQQQKYYIFVKGAPQKMIQNSINKPQYFIKLVEDISLSGFRSLAYGFIQIKDIETIINKNRQQLQTQLQLIGLATFENKLKDDTIQTIQQLRQADIQVKMITGDNIYIGIQTAIRAKIIKQQQKILVFQGKKQPPDHTNKYIARLLYQKNNQLKSQTIQMSKFDFNNQLIAMAVDNNFISLNPPFVDNIKIFARITPQSKAGIIRQLKQQINLKWQNQSSIQKIFGRTKEKVGMVGDGANDIMAIKQSDLGIGISQTDSSFAANFSISKLFDVVQIIKQGKNTLMIIIQIFKYYGIISFLKYVGATILVFDSAYYSDNQFTYFNYAQTLQIVIFYCFSHSSKKLSKFIPNDNLLSLQNHLSFLGHCFLYSAGLIVAYTVLIRSPQYIPNNQSNTWIFVSQSGTVIYLSSQIYFILSSIWIYTSQPWKQKLWSNKFLSIWLIIVIIVNGMFFFITKHLLIFFDVVELPAYICQQIFWITIAFSLSGYFWQSFVRRFKLYQK